MRDAFGFHPEALSAIASYVMNEYGYDGYRIHPIGGTVLGGGAVAVTHSDGSEIRLSSDRYGNITNYTEGT